MKNKSFTVHAYACLVHTCTLNIDWKQISGPHVIKQNNLSIVKKGMEKLILFNSSNKSTLRVTSTSRFQAYKDVESYKTGMFVFVYLSILLSPL